MSDGKKSLITFAQIGFIGIAFALVFSFVMSSQEGELRRRCGALCNLHPNYAGATRTAPDFSLPDMRGKTVSLHDYQGKVVVLNFWSKTCRPCLEELPTIGELTKVVRDRKDVAVVTVSTDDGPSDVREVLRTALHEEPPFPVLFDPERTIVSGKYGTHLYPETWIIDKRGVIRARIDRAQDWAGSLVIELIDSLRADSYCPVQIEDGHTLGEARAYCESPTES